MKYETIKEEHHFVCLKTSVGKKKSFKGRIGVQVARDYEIKAVNIPGTRQEATTSTSLASKGKKGSYSKDYVQGLVGGEEEHCLLTVHGHVKRQASKVKQRC